MVIEAERLGVLTVLMTGFGTVETAIEAMKKGAYDYLLKPIEEISVLLALARRVKDKGNSHNLVQRATRDYGHCTFTPTELVTTFVDLVRWVAAKHGEEVVHRRFFGKFDLDVGTDYVDFEENGGVMRVIAANADEIAGEAAQVQRQVDAQPARAPSG